MSYPGRDLEAGGRKKRTVTLKDALKGVKLAAGLPSESKSNLFLFLFFFCAVLFLHGQEAAGVSILFFKSLFQKGPKICFLLRAANGARKAAVSKPLFSCLREKGIRQALEPDSLAL